MLKKSQLFIVLLLTAVLVGCIGGFERLSESEITDATFTTRMYFVQGNVAGPEYDVTVTVPDEWVGQFATRNVGNILYFDYTGEGTSTAQIFTIEALSADQYWKQSGSYPGSYVNIVNRGDTFFIYNLPIDSHFSGLSDEDFQVLAEAVPQIIASFEASATN